MRTDLVCGESTLDGDREDDDGSNQVRKLMQVFPFFSHRGVNYMYIFYKNNASLPYNLTPSPFSTHPHPLSFTIHIFKT